MKVLFEATQAQFNETYAAFDAAADTDYYTRPNANSAYTVDNIDHREWFERPFYAPRGYGQGGYWTRSGYVITDGFAAYTSSGDKRWGVIEEDGKYYVFYSGGRSKAHYMPFYTDLINSTPALYRSSAPADMFWYDTEFSYVVRKGINYAAVHLAKTCGGVPQWGIDGQNACDIYCHFKKQDPAFGRLIQLVVLGNQDPETFLLRTLRNKKVEPENFTVMQQAAWSLLDSATRERMLRWG